MAKGVLACLIAVGLLAAVDAEAAGPKPTLRLVTTAPVTLQGSGFRTGERVRVTVATDTAKRIAATRTTSTGSFAVRIAAPLPYDPCTSSLVATAVGARGDSATLKLPQRACPPP
jgi:hypothetical protein